MTLKKKLEILEKDKMVILEEISNTMRRDFGQSYINASFYVTINGKNVHFAVEDLRIGLNINVSGLEKDDSFVDY